MRALAHPLRLRILRLALDQALTNKELAQRLERDPGTVLFHVRTLLRHGFLAPMEPRRGPRGTTERPYRATGKSWELRLPPNPTHSASVIDAVREELLEAGPDASLSMLRLGVRLRPDDLADLRRRVAELGDEFVERGAPDGEPIGILAVVHRRRP